MKGLLPLHPCTTSTHIPEPFGLSILCHLLTKSAGTPHNGSSIAACGKIIANVVAACSPLNPARGLLGSLQKDSQVLFEITEEFLDKAPELQLISFFEMEATNFVLFRKMVTGFP